ncbi:MAG: aminodeoxychorismate synthase component I [Planctomycetes bacterium]|nr:aminodeoxychorismate synthase component I [Planctomycetota bacterium]
MRAVPIVEELTPVPDPWVVAQSLANRSHLLFLDSSDRHTERGRYSYVAADPTQWFEHGRTEYGQSDVFSELNERLTREHWQTVPGLPPFQGGLAGLFGYGLGHSFERFPRPAIDEFNVPDVAVGLYDWVVAFDHQLEKAWIIARDQQRLRAAHNALRSNSTQISDHRSPAVSITEQFPLIGHSGVTSNFSRDGYLQAVRRAVEYVHAGDCFQVNVSQRLLAPLGEEPLAIYGRLRERNPAPFAGYLNLGLFAIASASPERFVRISDGVVESRPIKGTRPRGKTPEEDRTIAAELAAAGKDRAENVMIVDLLRNDLGRVCEYGTIRVPQVCGVETFRYVHHLVSVVEGRLRADQSPFDLLKATFPGGSVTGAPKVRALEIISELEPTARGPYCGSLGFIGYNGAMDSSILIRSFTIGRGWIQFPVGGGIVADSDPASEYDETLHKAAGMLSALKV